MTQLGDVTKYLTFNIQLASGDLYITDKVLLQEYGSISVSIESDQDLSTSIQFSNDGSSWFSSTQQNIVANLSEVITAVIIGLYCRIEVLNASTNSANINYSTYASTQPLALQGQLQSIGNSLPTFNIGNFSNGVLADVRTLNIKLLNDHKFIYSSVVGAEIIGPDIYLKNYSSPGLDPGSTFEIINNQLSLQNISASNLNEFMLVQGTTPIIYLGSGFEFVTSFKIDLTGYEDPNADIDNMMIGFGNSRGTNSDIIDGVFLGYPSAPALPDINVRTLSLIYYNNGVETYVPQTRWHTDRLNGTGPSAVTLDISVISIWRIRFAYNSSIILEFHLPYINQWQECHRIILEDISLVNPSFANPSFLFLSFAKRTTASVLDPLLGNIAILCSSANLGIEQGVSFANGGRVISGQYQIPARLAVLAGETHVFSIRCGQLINGKYNGSLIYIENISASVYNVTFDEVIFNVYTDGIFTTPTWTQNNPLTDGTEILTAGTWTLGSGIKRCSFIVQPGQSIINDLSDFFINMGFGQTLTFSCFAYASSRVLASISYKQLI